MGSLDVLLSSSAWATTFSERGKCNGYRKQIGASADLAILRKQRELVPNVLEPPYDGSILLPRGQLDLACYCHGRCLYDEARGTPEAPWENRVNVGPLVHQIKAREDLRLILQHFAECFIHTILGLVGMRV